jgi:hypothetical protein
LLLRRLKQSKTYAHARARTSRTESVVLRFGRRTIRGASLIALTFASRNGQSFDLSAGYLFKLWLPAFSRPGNEEQDQAVPGFTEPVVSRTFDTPKVAKAKIA